MTKGWRTGKSDCKSKDGDLRARVHFCMESGHIWLHEHRMLLVHAEAQATLRRELIETLGMERVQGLLTRMGYAAGMHDAELARTRFEGASDMELFMTGPKLHMLEGEVKVTPVKIEFDRTAGSFYGEFLWENSWEGQWHKRHFGTNGEPVCWSQIGYACGYSTAFMGRPILYKEVECVGMGKNNCRIIGKPIDEWEDATDYMRLFNRESIAEQLMDLQTQVVQLRSAINKKEKLPSDIVGNSKIFCTAYELLQQAAKSQITVLLLGETGVGKEVFARSLHNSGARSKESFIAINCAAIPHDLVESELFGVEKGAYTGAMTARAGRFERANGGTLFLDEIGDLPFSAQAKLLRVLQEGEIERIGDHKTRKVDVRLVAATNVDLRQLVKEGRFRSDLYYRLNAFQINIPPLRERKEDIPLLAKRFLEKYSAIHGKKLRGFTDKAKRALLSYQWPGNIREMQNMIERGVILAPSGTRIELEQMFSASGEEHGLEIGLDNNGSLGANGWDYGKDLCEAVFNGVMTLDQVEAMLIETAVAKSSGNLASAARKLGLTRRQLAYRLGNLRENEPAEPAIPVPREQRVKQSETAG
ncbi:aromatic catabolism-like sigma-54-dependent transcriptional regulator, XylR and V4R domain-containing [Geotalea daltonii FRC-32]|uniref:Aromatic catabolism-like sigma-54-dependent transcriptional regulator, XylR and V4R domain-containing n=1 Tax=Geotalea daltonii (strain DSM 22248 / JCM 15807 / FRC-32) TaxID=316067 RepID=B9M8I2_GEODF|nr:sigma-54-dependent Fis family transcriptional regulator [Geotalea daltonii]ACM18517.1 aromatic catabolism-like sigma-54-dependent transcriptional regulator, XylR and V4R domain-containing [Geotalea daltonii FRC-32]